LRFRFAFLVCISQRQRIPLMRGRCWDLEIRGLIVGFRDEGLDWGLGVGVWVCRPRLPRIPLTSVRGTPNPLGFRI